MLIEWLADDRDPVAVADVVPVAIMESVLIGAVLS